jgi:peptidoglycan/LPS O-acetylase OafA/YrhL
VFALLLRIGRYSHEIYLTHRFMVVTFLGLFLHAGKPMRDVLRLFIRAILGSGGFRVVGSWSRKSVFRTYESLCAQQVRWLKRDVSSIARA